MDMEPERRIIVGMQADFYSSSYGRGEEEETPRSLNSLLSLSYSTSPRASLFHCRWNAKEEFSGRAAVVRNPISGWWDLLFIIERLYTIYARSKVCQASRQSHTAKKRSGKRSWLWDVQLGCHENDSANSQRKRKRKEGGNAIDVASLCTKLFLYLYSGKRDLAPLIPILNRAQGL